MTSGSSSLQSSAKGNEEINQAETELYDRQIRLWGLDTQNRLRNSSVLLVGLSGLGAEVAKNLTLSGLKALTIMDNQLVSEKDFFSQFLLNPDSLSQKRAEASKHKTQVLNPMVELNVLTESLEAKPDFFFEQFNLVVLIDQKYDLVNRVNKICRKLGIRFQAGSVYGWTGYSFFDFNNHLFLLPKPKVHIALDLDDSDDECCGTSAKKFKPNKSVATVTIEDDEEQKIQQKVAFSSFESAFNIDWNSKQIARRLRAKIPPSYFPIRALLRVSNEKSEFQLDDLINTYKKELDAAKIQDPSKILDSKDLEFFVGPQLGPVCAIVGSVIGQEAIKALSQNDAPLKNVFIYSAIDTSGIVCELPLINEKVGNNSNTFSKNESTLVSNKLSNYEELFANRYTKEDEEYEKNSKIESIEPILIFPWYVNNPSNSQYQQGNNRGNNYRYNRNQYWNKNNDRRLYNNRYSRDDRDNRERDGRDNNRGRNY